MSNHHHCHQLRSWQPASSLNPDYKNIRVCVCDSSFQISHAVTFQPFFLNKCDRKIKWLSLNDNTRLVIGWHLAFVSHRVKLIPARRVVCKGQCCCIILWENALAWVEHGRQVEAVRAPPLSPFTTAQWQQVGKNNESTHTRTSVERT